MKGEKEMDNLTIKDLKEMDIVRRRDGSVCWILQNEYTKELQTFSLQLWGQHRLSNYYDNFKFGKNVDNFNSKRDSRYDIVEVSKAARRSTWKALQLMHDYIRIYNSEKTEEIVCCLKEFDWISV